MKSRRCERKVRIYLIGFALAALLTAVPFAISNTVSTAIVPAGLFRHRGPARLSNHAGLHDDTCLSRSAQTTKS